MRELSNLVTLGALIIGFLIAVSAIQAVSKPASIRPRPEPLVCEDPIGKIPRNQQ